MIKKSPVKTRTVMSLIEERRNPNYKGRNNKIPETGPLRLHKPAIYNTKSVSNPVISESEANELKGIEVTKPWVPQYK